jgi:hypothetical protein
MASADAEPEEESGGVRIAAGRTFLREAGRWVQHGYPRDAETQRITAGSEAYFALLARDPRLGPVFALGARVVFELDGRWYEIRPGQ